MALGDGSAVRLTIARYYTPTGRSIQKPYDNGNKEYFNDYLNRYKNGELISADSITVVDSLKYTTPGGRTVYGGGGIIPDIFVPKDTSYEKESLNFILRSPFMGRFIFETLENNREYYNNLSLEDFRQTNLADEEMVKDFTSYMARQGYELEVTEYDHLLKQYLKATIAQQLYGSNVFEQIVNEQDPMVEKVIELSRQK